MAPTHFSLRLPQPPNAALNRVNTANMSADTLATSELVRRRLNATFARKMLAHFEVSGDAVIERVAKEMPATYLKILAFLTPREMNVRHENPVGKLPDETLAGIVEELEARIAARLGETAKVIDGKPAPRSTPKELEYARAYYHRRKAERAAAAATPPLPQADDPKPE